MLKVLKRYIKDEKVVVIIYSIMLFLSSYFIIYIFPSIQEIKELENYIEKLPPFIQVFFGEEILSFLSIEGFLTTEFFNTTWVMICGIFTCLISSSIISGEIESKTIDIILSRPLKRYELLIGKFTGFIIYLGLLMFVTFLGLQAGLSAINEKVDFKVLISILFSGYFLFLTLASISLFLSCVFNESKKTMYFSIGIFISLYIFNIISGLLHRIKILKYLSLFRYFDASKIFKYEHIDTSSLMILSIVSIVFIFASIIYFERKNIHI